MNKKGNLFVISAPSGAGKGTVLKQVLNLDKNICMSVSATTRKPRQGEQDGVHYHFLTKDDFKHKIENDLLLEYATYADNFYGTPLDFIEKQLDNGIDVILEIEVQGASQVANKCPEATLIFIEPPSFTELEKRLISRGTEDMETIKKRLEIAKGELEFKDNFHFNVINDIVEDTAYEILNIIKQKRGENLC